MFIPVFQYDCANLLLVLLNLIRQIIVWHAMQKNKCLNALFIID